MRGRQGSGEVRGRQGSALIRGRQGSALIENALGHLESNIAAAVQDRFPLEKLEKAQ